VQTSEPSKRLIIVEPQIELIPCPLDQRLVLFFRVGVQMQGSNFFHAQVLNILLKHDSNHIRLTCLVSHLPLLLVFLLFDIRFHKSRLLFGKLFECFEDLVVLDDFLLPVLHFLLVIEHADVTLLLVDAEVAFQVVKNIKFARA